MKPKRKKKITQIMWAVGWRESDGKKYPKIQKEGAWAIFSTTYSAKEYQPNSCKCDVQRVRVTIEVL